MPARSDMHAPALSILSYFVSLRSECAVQDREPRQTAALDERWPRAAERIALEWPSYGRRTRASTGSDSHGSGGFPTAGFARDAFRNVEHHSEGSLQGSICHSKLFSTNAINLRLNGVVDRHNEIADVIFNRF